MLALKEFRSKAKGLPDLLPYAALIAPGVVLQKDGSFLAAWEFRGQDTASSTPEELAYVSAQFNNAVKLLGTGWMLHIDAVRSPQRSYPSQDSSHFPDPVTAMIEEERRTFFGRGLCYTTNTILTVTWKPDFSVTKMNLKQGTTTGTGLAKSLQQFENSLLELEDILSAVLHMHRLQEYETTAANGAIQLQSELLSHLQFCVSGEMHPIYVPATPMYLDALLGSEDLFGGIMPRLGDKYISVISIDGLPQESWPAMLSELDSLSVPYRFSTRFICLDQFDAVREIESFRKGWNQQVYRFIDQFFTNPNARRNQDASLMVDDAELAKIDVQSGMVGAGYLSSCLVLLQTDPDILQEQARELRRTLQTLGFGCRIETINTLDAWLGSHPGNSFANLRRPLVNTLNLADLLPLASVWTGNPCAPCPFYPPHSPPLAVLTTDGSTPFWFNLHEDDLGHTMIVGPPGSGKSTLLGLIAAQFRRYANSRIFAFDKGMSMFPLCLAAGGDHYEIGSANSLSFAPLQRVDESDAEFAWLAEWLESLLELQGMPVLPQHRTTIHTALKTLQSNPIHMRSLSDFCNVVQDIRIKEALQHYTIKGAMGQLLDAQTDALTLSPFMVFEIEELMQKGDKNLLPVLTYLFHRIETSLDGQPALLILDEAWIMLGHPVFRAKVREWLKVFRKANCAVVLATQSLTDATRTDIFDVLVDSCPTKILLPNHAARQEIHQNLYSAIGCNDRQISIIANAVPKRDYYVLAQSGRRLVQLALGPQTLAFIGVSDKENISRIRQLAAHHSRESLADAWLQEYRRKTLPTLSGSN